METVGEKTRKKPISVSGYVFQSPAEAKRALQEQQYIKKLKQSINPEDMENLYQLFIKLTAKGYFVTPIGFAFLHDLRSYLLKNGYNLDNQPIPVLSRTRAGGEDDDRANRLYGDAQKKQEESEAIIESLNRTRIRLTVAVVALIVVVVGMIFIVATSDNLGYVNAEQKVLDKYAHWEEELDAREKELLEWEKELNNQNE